MSEWEITTLGEVIARAGGSFKTGPFGTTLKASEYTERGVPVISVGEISPGALVLRRDTPRVSPSVTSRLSDYLLISGDIVFGRKGAVDRSAWVKPAEEGWFLGSDGIRVRLPSSVDSRFVAYQLQSEVVRAWLLQHSGGSTLLSLNQSTLSRVTLSLPPLEKQRAIAEVLGALDDKIAANTKLVNLLSDNLETSFTSVVGKPEGFVPFIDLATVAKGVSYRSVDLVQSRTALVTLKSFDRNGGYSARGLKDYAGAFKPVQQIQPGEIVVAQTDLTQAAEVVGRAIRVPASRNHDVLVASLDLAIVRPAAGVPVEFLLGLMLQGSFRAHCRSRTSGTTVLHLASDAIPTFSAPSVSEDVQRRYADVALPMLEMQDSIERESVLLAAIRDALLPQLMSGKLRVKDAEKVLEGVL